MTLLLTALLINAAAAQDCDLKDLQSQMKDASPQSLAGLYTELAACDAGAAKIASGDAFSKILPGEFGSKAAVAAISSDAIEPVRSWIDGQISDERARTLSYLGESCEESPAVVSFFVSSKAAMGDRFFRDRWHRGLTKCHSPAIQEMLSATLQEPDLQKDSSRFGSILEVYSRNAQANAIPYLKALAPSVREENQLHVISAFSDAAGVGSIDGMNTEAAGKAVEAILELAPTLPPKVVEQARIALESLGDTDAANNLAAVRYADVKQADGRFLWGAIATEYASCKKDKTRLDIHFGTVLEPGHRWADQMQEAVEAAVEAGWELNAAEKCKGTSEIKVMIPSAPFADEAAWAAWRDEQLRELVKQKADKVIEIEEPSPILD